VRLRPHDKNSYHARPLAYFSNFSILNSLLTLALERHPRWGEALARSSHGTGPGTSDRTGPSTSDRTGPSASDRTGLSTSGRTGLSTSHRSGPSTCDRTGLSTSDRTGPGTSGRTGLSTSDRTGVSTCSRNRDHPCTDPLAEPGEGRGSRLDSGQLGASPALSGYRTSLGLDRGPKHRACAPLPIGSCRDWTWR
jgi:hypothetical protein